ncbi:unnamed protein product [Ceutorhynchus assimilis]|uniref:Methylcytosine dioxygenase TET n=1 Tax=Ceutorhynchus assimilis TaxID=467358 RepID=A0A9P0GS26_9CUCU|nr:unnamed protein product [Ceutorhynchus assimilis]
MSETLSQDPDGLGVAYTTLAPSYPSTPATPSSTVQDLPPGANLPPFSTFAADIDGNGTFTSVSDRLFSDTRLLDISNWDYYTETRLVERGENGLSIITSQPQYRPWESKPIDSSTATFANTTQVNAFTTDAFANQTGASKLPSFQSQFQAFSEAGTNEPTLTTLTNLTPVSPNSSPQLTTLNSSFHTLSAVNPRNYPLVPAPIQAREIPSIQQQFLDERHIQLYSHPINNTIFPTGQNGAILQNSHQLISSPTVVTVLKSEPDIKLGSLHQSDLKLQNVSLHPTQFQNPMAALNSDSGLYNGIEKKLNGGTIMTSPSRNDFRKKERRKMRANSLESSAESDGASSNMDLGQENSGQVAAVSSTDGFKTQHMAMGMDGHDISGGVMDKQVKKKRKRCGECVGCQRKDNCGDCAPCRNDKSHQICKQRRCEKLTEKKSYRGRKANGPITPLNTGLPSAADTNGGAGLPNQQSAARPSPQPVTQPMPVQQQPMTPMPFYADPNRFPTPVWQADPSQVSGWQGQFIQQIPSAAQPIDTYQQYPNGIYQTTYQQPAFETNAFYTGAVQVLTPTNNRPPSVPNQQQQQQQVQMIPARPNSNYAHTPSPSPAAQQQNQQNANRQQYQDYNQFGSNTSGNEGSQSRPSSVNSVINQNPQTPNQNYQQQGNQQQQQQQQSSQQQTVYATVSTANFSPSSQQQQQQQTQYVNANSGNGQPGYPQVNASSPQVVSHNSSGYPGSEQFSGQPQNNQSQWQQDDHQLWERNDGNKIEYQHQQNEQHYMQQSDRTSSPIDSPQKTFSQADKVNLNTRIKTMILNKHQQNDASKIEQEMKEQQQNQQNTGHFLWYSHHHHLDPSLSVDGGPPKNQQQSKNTQKFAQNNFKSSSANNNELPNRFSNNVPTSNNLNPMNQEKENIDHPLSTTQTIDSSYPQYRQSSVFTLTHANADQKLFSPTISSASFPYTQQSPNIDQKPSPSILYPNDSPSTSRLQSPQEKLSYSPTMFASPESSQTWRHEKKKLFPKTLFIPDSSGARKPEKSPTKTIGEEIPQCNCFPSEQNSPEPGAYYTHLGCANSLNTLRDSLETQTGVRGAAIRMEKIKYTGKEGKTAQGCPIGKWIHRRISLEEKYLVLVKHRTGHTCHSAFLVVCLVVWEGVTRPHADELYSYLTEKLNKFGLPTKRRCATNEPRTCACQGIDEDTCGASFSFGCSWSMYYNGCKFTRSKDVRKFRLSSKDEEAIMEEKIQNLADLVNPLYKKLAPQSFMNQTKFENFATDCRLGTKPGRPFSGVTACIDFCAHAHKDIHNMVDGCTAVVTLTKHKDATSASKCGDEQLHVLPLYVADDTDEFGSKENQHLKVVKGELDILNKYECEVRTFSEPAEKCKTRRGKKEESQKKRKTTSLSSSLPSFRQKLMSPFRSPEIQNGQVSSTVLDCPKNWRSLLDGKRMITKLLSFLSLAKVYRISITF